MANLQIFSAGKPLTERQIEDFETELGGKLPSDYRSFLLRYNGGYTEPDAFKIRWSDDVDDDVRDYYRWSMLSRLFALEDGKPTSNVGDLITNYRDGVGQFPASMIPIGFDAGSNIILLSIKGEDRGRILYWANELEPDEDQPEEERIYTVGSIADNFDEFLNALYEPK